MTTKSPRARTRTRTPSVQLVGILIAATRTMVEADAAVTVRAVAAAAGVAPMSVYNHFSDKQGLLDAVVADSFDQLRGRLHSITATNPQDRLLSAGRAFREAALRSPRVFQLMWSRPAGDAGRRAFEPLVEIIRYGQVAGEFREGDPVTLAGNIWACVRGALSVELARRSEPSSLQSGTPRVDYDLVLHMLLVGLLSDPCRQPALGSPEATRGASRSAERARP